MKKPRTTAALSAILFTALLHAQEPLRVSVHFATASAELETMAGTTLDKLCSDIGDRSPTAVLITGHTDDRGSDSYNAALSQRRADAVRTALRAACPDLAGADIAWKGEQLPIADNSTEIGRAQNRRVDVTLSFDPEVLPDEELTGGLRGSPAIEPLMPLVDKKREHFSVDPSRAIDIRTSEGWTVHIDAGSVVDAAGRPVSGPVDLTCRAFFTPAEAIASGIPMYVGHGNDAGHMESAGMFEVLATRNGEPLSLAAGRTLKIERAMPALPGSGFNNYMLDPATGQWTEEGAYGQIPQEEVVRTITVTGQSADVQVAGVDSLAAWWTYQQEMRRVPRMPDTLSFRERQSSPNYCLTTACMPMRDPDGKWQGRVYELDRSNQIPRIQLRTGSRRLASPGRIYFRVSMERRWLHPEWNVFGEDRYWVYAGPMDREKWLDSVASRHLYQDIELITEPGSDEGILRLKSQGDWIELPLDLSTYRHTRADELAWDRQLATYQKRVAGKIRRFDDFLNSTNKNLLHRIEREENAAYIVARRRMRPEEKAMEKSEWIRGSQAQFAAYQARAAAAWRQQMKDNDPLWEERQKAQAVTASFTMRGFGIYNCDQILERRAIEPMVIAVVDENAQPFEWHTAYAVLDGRNAVITYWGNGTGRNDRMRLSADMPSMILVGKNNELLVVKEPGRQCAGRASARMQGTRSQQPSTPRELEALVLR